MGSNFSQSLIENNHKITIQNGTLQVPEHVTIPFIIGDGSGPDIWASAQRVLNSAIAKAYSDQKKINWMEVYAGQKAYDKFNTWLPRETLEAFREYKVGIKGPLSTPVGEGIRSLNVEMRKTLDLFVCQRPVRWFVGVPSPLRHPEKVDIVIFRENTEDIYTGIEFQANSDPVIKFLNHLESEFPKEYQKIRFPDCSGISIKPISLKGSERIVRAAIKWALENHRQSVTLVHKGNIMKFTEGAFRNWGFDLAEREFSGNVYTTRQWEQTRSSHGEEAANLEKEQNLKNGQLWINDMITDAAFEAAITRPQEFDVIVTTNLNGDYLSDAIAALVGGIGIAPGANINYDTGIAVFEATHGTAPKFAGKNMVNPSSVILSGEMLLRYIGWTAAADCIISAMEIVINTKKFTFDLFNQSENATLVRTSEFADEMIKAISLI